MFDHLFVRPVLAAVAALALVPAAHAAEAAGSDQPEVHSLAVSYHDLDLSTAKGRSTLHWRMRMAAQTVCGYDAVRKPMAEMAAAQACYDHAMRDAQVKLAAITTPRALAAR